VITNAGAQVRITMLTSYPSGSVYYTLDGTDPHDQQHPYTGEIITTTPLKIQAVAYDQFNSNPKAADPVVSLSATNGGGGGSVGASTHTDLYTGAASATIAATNLPGWTFMNWTGDSSSTNPIITLTMDQSRSAVALFGTTVAPTVTG